MTVGIQVYRGDFALALAVRLPALRVDWATWALILALAYVVSGLAVDVALGLDLDLIFALWTAVTGLLLTLALGAWELMKWLNSFR